MQTEICKNAVLLFIKPENTAETFLFVKTSLMYSLCRAKSYCI